MQWYSQAAMPVGTPIYVPESLIHYSYPQPSFPLGAVEPGAAPAPTAATAEATSTTPESASTPAPAEEPTQAARPWMLPAPIAQQAFSIASGIAGGLAGFVLATRVQNSLKVSAPQVLAATALSVAATFGAIFLIRTVEEWPSA